MNDINAGSLHDAAGSITKGANLNSNSAEEWLGLKSTNQCEEHRLMVALSSGAAETLRCLFFHGPTWDGNVPSKSGRDELVNMGLAARGGNGWQWLTRAGIEASFANKLHDEKVRCEVRERVRQSRIVDAAREIIGG